MRKVFESLTVHQLLPCSSIGRALVSKTSGWRFNSVHGSKIMESNAAGMVLRPALKTGFSEMGWGSTPLLSAKIMCLVNSVVECLLYTEKVGSSKLSRGTKILPR